MISTYFSVKQKTLFVVSLALFMEAVDATIINTAIPLMSRALNVYPLDLKIALICYLLSLAIFIPISGWLSDKWGAKRVFVWAIIIFTVSSLGCGYSNNLTELVIARLVQGLGGSMMLPVGRLIIARTFSRHELISSMTRIVMVGALGLMIGPVCGGLIVYFLPWNWIFWVNIPVGLLNICLAYFWLVDTPPSLVPPLDKCGFVLFGSGLAGLTYGLSLLSEGSVYTKTALMIMAIAILLLLFYVFYSRYSKHPIITIELFHLRTFQVSTLGNLLSRLGFGGLTFLLPLLFQIVLEYSPFLSGLLIAPTAIGIVLVKPFTLYLLRWFGYKRLLVVNTLLVALSLWSFSLVNLHTSVYFIAFLAFLFGFFISLQYSGMNSLAYAELLPENLSAATSVISTLQQVTQSFGVAVAAFFVTYFSSTSSMAPLLTVEVFHQTFFMMGVFTLCSVFIFMRLKVQDGFQMIYATEASESE